MYVLSGATLAWFVRLQCLILISDRKFVFSCTLGSKSNPLHHDMNTTSKNIDGGNSNNLYN